MPSFVKRILRNQFIVPFGRFRLKRMRQFSNAPILIGREGERAFLVDALTGIGERGAFLITGRRGVGKTTFVENCLFDYRQNVFRRFLGSGVGRSTSDYILLLVFALALLGVLSACGEFLAFLVPALSQNPLLIAPLLICVLVTSVPSILAFLTIRSAFSTLFDGQATLYTVLTVLGFVGIILFIPPFGAPTQAMGLLLMALGVLYAAGSMFCRKMPIPLGTLVCENMPDKSDGPIDLSDDDIAERLRFSAPYIKLRLFLFSVFWPLLITVGAVLAYYAISGAREVGELESLSPRRDVFFETLGLGLSFFMGATVANMLAVSNIIKGRANRPLPDESTRLATGDEHDLARLLVRKTLAIVGFLGASIALFFAVPVASGFIEYAFFVMSAGFFGTFIYHWRSIIYIDNPRPAFAVPPIEALLLLKGFAMLLVSLQLLYPVLGLFGTENLHTHGPTSGDNFAWHQPMWLWGGADLSLASEHVTLFAFAGAENTVSEAGTWFLAVLLLMVCFFFVEYAWINRPFVNQRQPRTLDRGPRKPQQLHHHMDPIWFEVSAARQVEYMFENFEPFTTRATPIGVLSRMYDPSPEAARRQVQNPKERDLFGRRADLQKTVLRRFRDMERYTFTYVVARLWLPVVEVNVNLGFDALDHRGVTHAMLDGLYRAYRATFVRLGSPYQIIRAFGLTFSIMIALVVISRSLVDFPSAGQHHYDQVHLTVLNSQRDSESPKKSVSAEDDDIKTPKEVRDLLHREKVTWTSTKTEDLPEGHSCRFLAEFEETRKRLDQERVIYSVTGLAIPTAEDGETPLFPDSTWSGTALLPKLVCLAGPQVSETILNFLFLEVIELDLSHDFRVALDPNHIFMPSLLADETTEEKEKIEAVVAESATQKAVISTLPVFWFVHGNVGLPSYDGKVYYSEPSLTLRLYHILIALVLYRIATRLGQRYPFFPYRRNLKRIKALIDELTLRRADTQSTTRGFSLSGFFGSSGSHEASSGVELSRDALDPRSVELRLLALLNDLREKNNSGFSQLGAGLTVPKPDIHFVFDELDKLSGVAASEYTAHNVGDQESRALDGERQRAYQLHRLLSDMKRVIASAPVRFIFVGGRSLHDEWIRDQNRLGTAQPLLTSIFDHEIYLQSLLVDLPRTRHENALVNEEMRVSKSLDLRVKEFLIRSYLSARELENELRISRYLPWLALPRMESSAQSFCDHVSRREERFELFSLIDARVSGAMIDQGEEAFARLEATWRREFFTTFVGFLAYRSAGSPKKLNELIGELIRPSGSFLSPEMPRRSKVPESRDALVVDEKTLYRMQFINSLFRHIETSFGVDLLERDDKITINTIFMLDFLMKLHDRAFSLSSIERLDELAHIHRAPDLRRLFDSVITNSAERYFHRVLNGLFVFRFRSELAIEIRYLSRISQEEMAALNFTLDESQELKTTFTAMLEQSAAPNSDLLTALGELYEFDQAYDVARDYYERALVVIDDEFMRLNGQTLSMDDPVEEAIPGALERKPARWGSAERMAVLASHRPGPSPEPFLHALLDHSEAGRVAIRMNLPWAIRRVRLMLQIGLTYEQQADEERAQAQYQAAQVFSSTIIAAALVGEDDTSDPAPLSHVIKHLSLVFQPVFASAWLAEKLESGVDTSLSIVEREMRFLRANLPFVKMIEAAETEDPEKFAKNHAPLTRNARSNHALVMAELQNKTGDLYFFKGRAAFEVPEKFVESLREQEDNRSRDGYLMRAHYYYALALHDVRRFVFYRAHISRHRLDVVGTGSAASGARIAQKDRSETLDRKNLPTFVMQTTYSSLVDLSEVTLARSSLLSAWLELDKVPSNAIGDVFESPYPDLDDVKDRSPDAWAKNLVSSVRSDIDNWLFWSDAKTCDPPTKGIASVLTGYFGSWNSEESEDAAANRITFSSKSAEHERILIGLVLSLAAGRAVNRANFPDAASFESQISAEHVLRLLRSARGLLVARYRGKPGEDAASKSVQRMQEVHGAFNLGSGQLAFLSALVEFGVMALERIQSLNHLAYPEGQAGPDSGDYKCTDTSSLVATALVAEFQLVVSGLITFVEAAEGSKEQKATRAQHIEHWQSAIDQLERSVEQLLWKDVYEQAQAYQLNFPEDEANSAAEKSRRKSRSVLIYLVTHHKYPMLTNMNALKALIDDAAILDGCFHAESAPGKTHARLQEAKAWVTELIEAEKLLDAPMHFPPSNMADTLSLMLISHPTLQTDEGWKNLARKYRWRAEQSYTMGRQYYQNLSRLVYLFDDLNDRRRHSVHAGQMNMADMMALYRHLLDDRELPQ